MTLVAFVFIVGVVVSLILGASLVFTIYEVRRTNPQAFPPKSQDKSPSDS